MQALSTACGSLDRLLDGGLEADAITLVFGEGGSGKTNLALQCAREVALRGKRTAYVDTEGVSAIRLRQVFGAHARAVNERASGARSEASYPSPASPLTDEEKPSSPVLFQTAAEMASTAASDGPEPGGSSLTEAYEAAVANTSAAASGAALVGPVDAEDVEALMERVLFYQPYTIEEQERLVQNATRGKDLGLVVVDSINMHYRLAIDGGGDAEQEAARSLYKQLHHLTGFARKHGVPVLVTGQVYGGEDATQPFARRVMEHLVKALVRFEKRPDGTRRATVIKHRSIEEGRSVRFRIGANGLEDL